MIKHSEEFKQEAVRIALTSGLPRHRVASDLGIGKSRLGKWVSQYRPGDLGSTPQADLALENERLRLENRVLRQSRGASVPPRPSFDFILAGRVLMVARAKALSAPQVRQANRSFLR